MPFFILSLDLIIIAIALNVCLASVVAAAMREVADAIAHARANASRDYSGDRCDGYNPDHNFAPHTIAVLQV